MPRIIHHTLKSAAALIVVVCLLHSTALARSWYIAAGAPAYSVAGSDGTTLAKAFGNLEYATNNAVSGDVIYVGAGTFTPPPTQWVPSTRWSSFYVKAGVTLIGGYGGGETRLQGRNNSTFSVMVLEAGSDTTRVSNITFPSYTYVTQANSGGGAIDARGNVNLVVNSCIFSTPTSVRGGALYVADGAYARVSNSDFAGCVSGDRGGAIAVENATLVLQRSTLHDCVAQKGGAIYTNAANVLIEDARLYSNKAIGTANGGAVYVDGGTTIAMKYTSMANHEANNGGGGLFINGANSITLDYCTIAFSASSQWTTGSGVGGNTSGNISISNSIISGNVGGGSGNLDINTTGINISNSLLDNNLYDGNGLVASTLDKDSINITVGDSGRINVALPPTITTSDGETDNPVVDDGSTTIGAGGGQAAKPPMSVTLTLTDSIMCVGSQTVLTAQATNAKGNLEYRFNRVWRNGVAENTLLTSVISNSGAASMSIQAQDTSAQKIVVEVYSGKSKVATSTARLVLIIPQTASAKIDHGKNVVDN